LQRGQKEAAAEMGKMEFNLDLVGRMSQAIFHSNKFSLAFSLIFHKGSIALDQEERKAGEV
jgi:hypothetical protein